MVEIPDSLVERLKSRQVVLVAGLGCNQLAGAPGWSAFTETLAAPQVFSDDRAALAKLIASGRLADAIALIRDLLPHPTLEAAITKAYPGGAPVPDSVKQAAAFPWRAIVTTGFDDLWQRALGEASSDPPRVMVGTEASAQQLSGGPGMPLLHLFGRVAQPRSLCLGPGDARVRLIPSASLAWLDQLRRRRSLILVGFRPTDPDLVWLSSWLAARPSPGTPHYLFLDVSDEADPETEALTWRLRTGMEILPCVEGTLEAMGRLAKLSASIAAGLPPSEADIDLDRWLDRWARNPADPEPPRILARAEGALRDEERWDRLVELLLRRLDLQEDRRDQIKALAEVARIFRERLGAPERALTAGVAMLRLLPTDDDLWEKLRADARASGAWQQLVAEAMRVAAAAESAPGAGRIWREIARVEREELDHPEEALAAYREALVVEPGRRETRDAQAEILRELGRWEELVSVLRAAAAEAGDPMGALALTLETAELLESNLHDVGGAIAAFESALAIAPDSEITALALERLCEREKRWADLARLLDRRAGRASADEARAMRRRRVEILIDHLDALDQAAEALEGLAADDRNDRATLGRLEEVYRRARRHDDTLRVLQMQADAALGPADRLAILRKLAAEGAALPDGLGRAARALDEILRLEPRDADAFPELVRIYKSEGPPAALADILSRRLEVIESAEARRELLLALAETYERELDDPEKALDAYAAAGNAGDQLDVIHEATARLAERLGRWELCAASLQKWAEIAPEAELRAEAFLEAALIFTNRLGDSAAAERALGRVLENAPGHPKALATLARLRRDAGDREKAVELFLEAAAAAPDGKEKAELFTAAATSLQNERAQEDRAVDLLTRAMAADPDHVPAGERLADLYAARGLWTEALALLDMLARRVDPGDAERLAVLETRRAGACLEIGKTDKALECLTKAYELRPESLAVLRPFAELRARRGEWKQAAELSRAELSALQRLDPPASAPETLEVTLRLGRCQAELREVDGAIATYRDALTLEPTCRKALEALVELRASAGDWSAWVRDREALVALAGADERAALWEEIGDACAEKLLDRERAEAAYRKALEAEPGRRATLHKLLDIYTKDGRWEPAIEVLTDIARVETEPAIKAKTLHAAALIWRDEIGQPGFAAQLLERCLDEAPEMTVAFDELGRLHEEAGDWKALARSTRAMLERLDRPATTERAEPFPGATGRELRLRLWSQLGEVAFRHLHDRNLAMTAFEAAAALDPGNVRREETLAHLYDLAGPDARDRAVRAHQRLIARDHHRTDSYLALAKVYGETGNVDAQWCVAAALAYLQKGGPAVEPFFRQHRPPGVRVARQSFTEEVWQRLRHPDEDALLDELAAVAAPYLMPLAAQTRASLGLQRGSEVDVAGDQSGPVRAVAQIATTLGLPLPDLFRSEGETSQTTLVNLHSKGQSKTGPRPGLVLGPATLRRSSFDLVFDLSNHMASLRPERFLKFALRTPATLELGLRVVLAVTGAAEDPYKGQGEAGQLAAYLRKNVPAPVLAQLTASARKLVEARGKHLDIARWIASGDLSAARVALALTGDLGAATRVLRSELIPRSPVPIHKRLADLVAFSVSEDYFACRKLLGLQVAAA